MSEPDVLFLNEAAALARVSESSLYKLVRSGTIKASKRLGRWRIKRTELQRWLDSSDASRPAAVPVRARSASAPTEHGSVVYPWDRRRAARS